MANIWKNSLQSTRHSLAIIYKNTEVGMPDFFCDTQSQFRNLKQALLQLQFRNLKKMLFLNCNDAITIFL
jgi:hypothetical protein